VRVGDEADDPHLGTCGHPAARAVALRLLIH
jgi:hypothetical protein